MHTCELNFYMQERQPQPLPLVLTFEQGVLSYRDVAPFSFMLRLEFRGQTRAVLDRVLSVFPGNLVDALINPRHLLDLRRVVEQSVLNLGLRDKTG